METNVNTQTTATTPVTPIVETTIATAVPAVSAEGTATAQTQIPVLYPHEQLIAEEKIDAKALPKEIKNHLQMWNLQRKRFEKTNNDVLGTMVKKKSIVIADMIQNHTEKDLPEQIVAPVVPVVAPVIEKLAEEKPRFPHRRFERPFTDDNQPNENGEGGNNTVKNPAVFRKPVMNGGKNKNTKEELILKNLDAKGYIHYKKVGEILGIKSFDFSIRVSEAMILDNEYMSEFYTVRKKESQKK
jgi:hypothetical protein